MMLSLRRLLFGAKSAAKDSESRVEWRPAWLGDQLLSDELPWNQAQHASVDALLQLSTLHDSRWLGVWLVPGQGLVGVIRWEVAPAALDDDRWRAFADRAGSYPILALCFQHVYRFDQEVPAGVPDPWVHVIISRVESA